MPGGAARDRPAPAGPGAPAAASPEFDLKAFRQRADELIGPIDGSPETSATAVVWRLVRVATELERELDSGVHRPLGWSWTGFRILYNTYVLGSVGPHRLSQIVGVSAPSISSALATLERDGFITRKPSPVNRKNVDVSLTRSGKAAVKRALPLQHAAEAELIGMLDEDERAELAVLLDRILFKRWSK